MTATIKGEKAGRSHWLPIALGLLLLGLSVWCLWIIRDYFQEREAGSRAYEAEIAQLANRKKDYETLIGLEPCAAQELWQKSHKEAAVPQASEAGAKSSPAPAGGVSLPVEDIEDACVFLVSGDGSHLMTGSGFFVAPGIIATNRHVVEKGSGKVLVTSKALGEAVQGQVVAIAPPGDLDCAIVSVQVPEKAKVSILPFAQNVKKTQKIGAWGFPDLVGKNDPGYRRLLKGEDIHAVPELSYTEGVVSAILDRVPHLIVHTASISPGNSGGPLVNEQGEIVGINTLITLDEDSYRQASIAISGEEVKSFLASHGVSPRTGNIAKQE